MKLISQIDHSVLFSQLFHWGPYKLLTNCMETFIGQGFISGKICQNLIELFNNSVEKGAGTIWCGTVDGIINSKEKSSTECRYSIFDEELTNFRQELQSVLEEYIKTYPYCNSYSGFTITEQVKIQYYRPGEGYVVYHTERGSPDSINSSRHLVFMTYLNTVKDGGGTEFFHQKLITSAEQGKTLIWPADWTHTHRGITSLTEEKYIVTGWYSFI